MKDSSVYYYDLREIIPVYAITPGFYAVLSDKTNYAWALSRIAHSIWKQGSRGGIKLIHHSNYPSFYGYISNNEKLLREFMLIKLSAKII